MDSTYFETLEEIEHLITNGIITTELMAMFPEYDKEIINKIIHAVDWDWFLSYYEPNMRTISGKEYIVRSVFSDSGKDIKNTILKLAERKTMREMGVDIPLEFERNNPL